MADPPYRRPSEAQAKVLQFLADDETRRLGIRYVGLVVYYGFAREADGQGWVKIPASMVQLFAERDWVVREGLIAGYKEGPHDELYRLTDAGRNALTARKTRKKGDVHGSG